MDAGLDPIFQAREPEEKTPRAARLLWQFFFFPLLIVAACLVPVVIVMATRGGEPTPKDLLDTVLRGAENAQKQAAQQLASAIAKARNDEDAAAREGKERDAPFYAHPEFAAGLRAAFEDALRKDKSEERQVWLAQALGRTGDPAAVPLLVRVLYGPSDQNPKPSQEVRRAAAVGLMFMESRAAEDALVRASADPDDSQVRAIAMNALALLAARAGGAAADGPAVAAALKRGLDDEHAGVRLNAAYALAVRGDPSGLDLLERSLERESLGRLGVHAELQTGALANATRGIVALSAQPWGPADQALTARLEGLRARLEALARNDGDERVRQIAREGLDRWRKN